MKTNVTRELILTHKEYDFLRELYDEVTIEFYEEIDWGALIWAVAHNKPGFLDGSQKIIITYED